MNIAEILKDKKEGIKLYSPILGECFLRKVDTKLPFSIVVESSRDDEGLLEDSFSQDGRYFNISSSECLIFPSKHMREWTSFAWKKGDILANQTETKIVLFDSFTTDEYTYFNGKYCYSTNLHDFISNKDLHVQLFTNHYHKINSEDAKKYIKIIEENFKGKFNMETLKINSSRYNFKPFDKVVGRTDSGYWRIDFFEFYNVDNKHAPYQCMMDAYKECLPYNDKTAKLISTCADYVQN
jgi:hypothetical protein